MYWGNHIFKKLIDADRMKKLCSVVVSYWSEWYWLLQELTDQEKKEYIERIKKAKLVCPRCGAKLILRKAAKGNYAGESFYGCSNFPKCRYTKEIGDSQ